MKAILYKILSSGLIKRILNPKFKIVSEVKEGKICIILSKGNALGDLIMHNFIVQQLNLYGYEVTYAMSSSFYKKYNFFFEKHSLTNNYLILPNNKSSWLGFTLEIKKSKIKAVISDRYPLISTVFFYLAGVPVIIGPPLTQSECENRPPSVLYTKNNNIDKNKTHYTCIVISLLDLLENKRKRNPHSIYPFFPFERVELSEIHNSKGSISIHIGGDNYWNRKWPFEKYVELCELFINKYAGVIFLLGGKEEHTLNEKLKDILEKKLGVKNRIVNFCGVDLNTTATIISSSDLFIGNDSGPQHIANALNKRIIGIFGPSHIHVVNPHKYDNRNVVIHADLPCVPCLKPKCELPEDEKLSCLTKLPTKAIWKHIESHFDLVRNESPKRVCNRDSAA